eukprot:4925564-Pleurochrysis_carterae.AAC.1
MSAAKRHLGSHGYILSGIRAVVPAIRMACLIPTIESPSVGVGGFRAWLKTRRRCRHRPWSED